MIWRVPSKHILYSLGFVVAPTKKMARGWFKNRPYGKCLINRQTGKSLAPLLWAKEQIVEFLEEKIGEGILSIAGTDEKRVRAYAALKKLGFVYSDRTEEWGITREAYQYAKKFGWKKIAERLGGTGLSQEVV